MPHAVIKLGLSATISGPAFGTIEFDDVLSYTSSFAMNSIPAASLVVAVGTNVDTQQLATIHEAIKVLTTQLKTEVFLKTRTLSLEQATTGLPKDSFDDPIKIFEGHVVGTGWRRTERGANFVIHLLHWLGDINYASAVSASSHPGNPASLTYPAVYKVLGTGGRSTDAGEDLAGWVSTVSDRLVTPGALDDIWGSILHPWMVEISKDDPLDAAMGGVGGGNVDILAALARIVPNVEGKPLNLRREGIDAGVIADGVRQALVNETGNSWANTTLWGKLIGEWAPSYMFSVIPRIDDALIVPFAGGLKGEPWAVIGAEDYNQADMNAQMHQVLQGVGISYPVMFSAGSDLGLGILNIDTGGVAGLFTPDDIDNGMWMFKDAPKWLSDPLRPFVFASAAEAIGGGATQTSMDESGAGAPKTPANNPVADAAAVKSILNLYAQQWFILESLKGRTGEVSGKLRFDISPGSNVLVQASGAKNVAVGKNVQEDIYATVTQVTYVINAESQRAGTAFSLAHIRSAAENMKDSTSIEGPPLYQDTWRGAVMVADHAEIKPEGTF